MFLTNRQVFLDRISDVRQRLLDLERLLYKLPDESGVYVHNQARLVAWAHLDTAWSEVYRTWSMLSGEECDIAVSQREQASGMGAHQVGE